MFSLNSNFSSKINISIQRPRKLLVVHVEMDVVEVDQKVLKKLEALGFSWAQAVQALANSGNSSLEDAVNWIIDHANDPDIDNIPSVAVNIDIESPDQPSDNAEEIKWRAQELRKKKDEEEKKLEREREKERIRAGKARLDVKRIAEENEMKRNLALRRADKEEERRAREKIRQKLEADKLERRRGLGLSSESPSTIQSSKLVQAKKNSLPVNPANPLPVKAITKAERMRQCLTSLRLNHKDDAARVRRAFQTLLLYVRNVAKNPDVEKFRKIRLGNPLFQDRVANLRGGIEFLELCGFERIEGGEFLYLSRDKVDMEVLKSAGFQLNSALTNPFFGLLSKE